MHDPDDLVLPEGTRLVHIGPPKTGTTAIQRALLNRRADLRELGVVFPGKGARPRAAGWAVVGAGVPRGRPVQPTMADWDALVDEVEAAGDQRVVVSNESFADGYADAVKVIVDGLGGERIHVVHTVRRVDKLLNSHWQQRVQAGLTLPYDDWLRIVLGEPNEKSHHWRGFWRHHDLADVMDRWVSAAGAENITVIIADEDDRNLLPRLFERFLDLPEGYLHLESDDSNRSMSRNEIEMLRLLHAHGRAAGWSDELFRRVLRFGVVDALMRRPRDPDDERIQLPAWAAERVAELNDERVDIVRSLGVRVIGDPEMLRSSAHVETADDSTRVRISAESAAEATAAAIDAGEAWRAAERAPAKRAAPKKVPEERERHNATRPKTVEETASRDLLAEVRRRIVRRLRSR